MKKQINGGREGGVYAAQVVGGLLLGGGLLLAPYKLTKFWYQIYFASLDTKQNWVKSSCAANWDFMYFRI